jgi:hypothetical protein
MSASQAVRIAASELFRELPAGPLGVYLTEFDDHVTLCQSCGQIGELTGEVCLAGAYPVGVKANRCQSCGSNR